MSVSKTFDKRFDELLRQNPSASVRRDSTANDNVIPEHSDKAAEIFLLEERVLQIKDLIAKSGGRINVDLSALKINPHGDTKAQLAKLDAIAQKAVLDAQAEDEEQDKGILATVYEGVAHVCKHGFPKKHDGSVLLDAKHSKKPSHVLTEKEIAALGHISPELAVAAKTAKDAKTLEQTGGVA